MNPYYIKSLPKPTKAKSYKDYLKEANIKPLDKPLTIRDHKKILAWEPRGWRKSGYFGLNFYDSH